jgi:hypothetical protein
VAARTQSSKKSFQTGTGLNPAFYMYERRYATEPFTTVEPAAPVDWTFGPRAAERAEAAGFRLCGRQRSRVETAMAASRR